MDTFVSPGLSSRSLAVISLYTEQVQDSRSFDVSNRFLFYSRVTHSREWSISSTHLSSTGRGSQPRRTSRLRYPIGTEHGWLWMPRRKPSLVGIRVPQMFSFVSFNMCSCFESESVCLVWLCGLGVGLQCRYIDVFKSLILFHTNPRRSWGSVHKAERPRPSSVYHVHRAAFPCTHPSNGQTLSVSPLNVWSVRRPASRPS